MSGAVPTAGIVIIGDEILSGKFVEENAAFLIGELRALGVELRRIEVIPDDADDIAATVVRAAGRCTWVFTSGGVGPTHDDVTIASIARGFGVGVVRHAELEAKIRVYWGERLVAANLRMADVPEGAELVYGKDGVWPVVALKNVFILPGVPSLFRRKFVDIRDRFRSAPAVVARLYVDAEEGSLADEMTAVAAAWNGVKIGSYPRFAETDFRVLVTFEGADGEAVRGAYGELERRLGVRVVRREEPHSL
jgi:molybdenum cofactor synthesis domain-containing protein